jgi:phage baseplate assembly protein W
VSFDLKIEGNDLSINPDGSVKTVRNNDKLIQDILKIILTVLGSNKYFKWYGCLIRDRVIGQMFDETLTQLEIQRAIQDSLTNLIALQKAQSVTQYVSPGESISMVKDIMALRNESDPRQYEIYISVFTKKLTIVETTFQLRL